MDKPAYNRTDFFLYCSVREEGKHSTSRLPGVWLMVLLGFLVTAHSTPLFASDGLPGSNGEASDIESEIIVEQSDNILLVSGRVFNHGKYEQTLEYRLELERSGTSGTSRTAQSGRIRLEPGGQTGISETRVNAGRNDTCRITLTILDDRESIVSTSNVVFSIK